MTKDIRALNVYTNVAAAPSIKQIRVLIVFTNVAAAPTKDFRALFVFTNAAAAPENKQVRTLYVFTNVDRLTNPNDGVEVQLLDENLEIEKILKAK